MGLVLVVAFLACFVFFCWYAGDVVAGVDFVVLGCVGKILGCFLWRYHCRVAEPG